MGKHKEIFDLLSKGKFICDNSIEERIRKLYNEIENNYEEYLDYFEKLEYSLKKGEGYFYFVRNSMNRTDIEDRIMKLGRWIDILSLLKTYSETFSSGTLFRPSHMLERFREILMLREKAKIIFGERTNTEYIEEIKKELLKNGFCEALNDGDDSYKVVSAFLYIEKFIDTITIYSDNNINEEI